MEEEIEAKLLEEWDNIVSEYIRLQMVGVDTPLLFYSDISTNLKSWFQAVGGKREARAISCSERQAIKLKKKR